MQVYDRELFVKKLFLVSKRNNRKIYMHYSNPVGGESVVFIPEKALNLKSGIL